MSDLLISFDPGLRQAGLAVFRNKVLTFACLVKNPEKEKRDFEAWRAITRWIRNIFETKVALDSKPHLVYEFPQVYQQGRQKGDQDDLMQLTGVNGSVCMMLDPERSFSYRPREWKGQVPKEIHNQRVLNCLTDEEKTRIEKCAPSLLHNVLDGIGLGLFHLGRLQGPTIPKKE